jgi:SP family general alpha glucoside:H+ symporter-like MFS transporter
MYASQNFAGNLIANQATFSFERELLPSGRFQVCRMTDPRVEAGISTNNSFQLNLIISCLSFVANTCSWFLTAWFGRRIIYLWGTANNVVLLFILGICASAASSDESKLEFHARREAADADACY